MVLKNSFSSESLLKKSYFNFPILAYIASFLIFLGIPGLAEILHTFPSSAFIDVFYDAIVLFSVNSPFILWAVLFLFFLPRFFLVLLSFVFFFCAAILFYIILSQVGFTVLAAFSVIGLIFLGLSALFSYYQKNLVAPTAKTT